MRIHTRISYDFSGRNGMIHIRPICFVSRGATFIERFSCATLYVGLFSFDSILVSFYLSISLMFEFSLPIIITLLIVNYRIMRCNLAFGKVFCGLVVGVFTQIEIEALVFLNEFFASRHFKSSRSWSSSWRRSSSCFPNKSKSTVSFIAISSLCSNSCS